MTLLRIGAAALALSLSFSLSAGAAPLRDPVAGPLEVFANASGSVQPGGILGIGFAYENHSAHASIDVIGADVLIRWSDGSTWRLRLDQRRQRLAPGSGTVFFPTLIIPADAPVGTAVLEVRAHVARVAHAEGPDFEPAGGIGHRDFASDGQAVDTATFDVIP